MIYVEAGKYRKDIDGLRAIAVLSVILFHFGILRNGYLGVDVFFVISGYLITGIILNEINDNCFSVTNFYVRRIRRIIPLSLFISSVALAVGVATMLPDDLENLAQSVVATSMFSNNILQVLTTKNYWDVVNEFKPLMHTWSLGIEEQYYLFYPLLFWFLSRGRRAWILPLLYSLTIISLLLYVSPLFKDFEKFYLIPFRLFELSAGGVAAVYLRNRLIVHEYSFVLVAGLLFVLFSDFSSAIDQSVLLPISIVLALGIISSSNDQSILSSFVLKNRIMVFGGLISFSLYMWHQVLLAYTRYFVVQKLEIFHLSVLFLLTVLLSIVSHKFIERPFRNKGMITTKALLLTMGALYVVINSAALYIYWQGGVLKDIPELGIAKSQAGRNIHAKYNARIHAYDKEFKVLPSKIRVLVIGNSFARDWVNVLLESKYKDNLDISYVFRTDEDGGINSKVKDADVIFFSTARKSAVEKLKIDVSKLYVIGTKNFGVSAGIFYNYRGRNYFQQRTRMEDGYLDENKILSDEWGDKYIDYIKKIADENMTVPVFTPDRKFISQDCRHFTKAGARYFARLFEKDLAVIFSNARNK